MTTTTWLLFDNTPCGVQIVEPGIYLGPHLLLIFVFSPLKLHLFHLSAKLSKDLSAYLIHQVFPDNKVLLGFDLPFLNPNYWQSSLPRLDRLFLEAKVVVLL